MISRMPFSRPSKSTSLMACYSFYESSSSSKNSYGKPSPSEEVKKRKLPNSAPTLNQPHPPQLIPPPPPPPQKKNQNHGACKNWKLLLIPELYKVSSSYCTQRSFSLKGGLSYEINLRIQFIPLKQETWECNKGSCGLVSVGNIIFTFSLKFI